jgi:hypothetical protein
MRLSTLSEEQLDTDLTVVLLATKEVVPVIDFVSTWEVSAEDSFAMGLDIVDAVLEDGHPFFTIDW